MIALALRVAINAVALWAASRLIDGITLSDDLLRILWVAFLFGIINAVLKPIAKFLTFPIILVTLGLFTVVVNAGLLLLTDWLTDDLTVDGFWNAVLGAIVISLVSWAMSMFLPDGDRR